MKFFYVLCTTIMLVGMLSGAERLTAWQTRGGDIPTDAIVWNYAYGQHELGRDAHDQPLLTKQEPDAALYGTACAAIAPAAIAILGTRFGANDIARAPADRIALIMREILTTGATAYDTTAKDPRSGFAEAEAVVKTIAEQNQRLPIRINTDLIGTYATRLDNLFGPGYEPEQPLRMLLELLQKHVQENQDLGASGVVLSSGAISHALGYIRGAMPRQARFILYDSHTSFAPDHMQRLPAAQTAFAAAHTQAELDAMDPVAAATLHEESLPLYGSFLAIAPTVDALIQIARADGRWPVDVASRDELPYDLQSPVFIDVRRPRSVSAGPASGATRRRQASPDRASAPASPAPTIRRAPHGGGAAAGAPAPDSPVSGRTPRRPPATPKERKLDKYQQARVTAETFIKALEHAHTTSDFEEIAKQFQDAIGILSESAQNELIVAFVDAQTTRERELTIETERAKRAAQELAVLREQEERARVEAQRLAEQAQRAAEAIRVSPTRVVEPASRISLAERLVKEAEELAEQAQKTKNAEEIKKSMTRINEIAHGRFNQEHRDRIDAALSKLYVRFEELGGW